MIQGTTEKNQYPAQRIPAHPVQRIPACQFPDIAAMANRTLAVRLEDGKERAIIIRLGAALVAAKRRSRNDLFENSAMVTRGVRCAIGATGHFLHDIEFNCICVSKSLGITYRL